MDEFTVPLNERALCRPGYIEYRGKRYDFEDKVIVLQHGGRDYYVIYMPGLESIIVLSDAWKFDGNVKCPTFFPSIRSEKGEIRNHAFITLGVITFLSDCTHKLKCSSMGAVPLRMWYDKL